MRFVSLFTPFHFVRREAPPITTNARAPECPQFSKPTQGPEVSNSEQTLISQFFVFFFSFYNQASCPGAEGLLYSPTTVLSGSELYLPILQGHGHQEEDKWGAPKTNEPKPLASCVLEADSFPSPQREAARILLRLPLLPQALGGLPLTLTSGLLAQWQAYLERDFGTSPSFFYFSHL